MGGPFCYRAGVGIVLINAQGLVFAGHRRDGRQPAWQMPQGGLEPGEIPEDAVFREMGEELGTRKGMIVRSLPDWLAYEYPDRHTSRKAGQFRGQCHRWYLVRFTGHDHDIRLDAGTPEFSHWRWTAPQQLVEDVAPFKQEVYRRVMSDFIPTIRHLSVSAPVGPTVGERASERA